MIAARISDHNPILISSFYRDLDFETQRGLRKRGFKFEASWSLSEDCEGVIKNPWFEGSGRINYLQTVHHKLQRYQCLLSSWSKEKFSKVDESIKQKTKKLEELQLREGPDVQGDIRTIQKELDDLMEHEELKWKQRAKQHWLLHGDKNTK